MTEKQKILQEKDLKSQSISNVEIEKAEAQNTSQRDALENAVKSKRPESLRDSTKVETQVSEQRGKVVRISEFGNSIDV